MTVRVTTSSGWILEVAEMRWWSVDDGAAFGRAFDGSTWSDHKYLGTVRGIEQMRVKRLRSV